MCEYDSRPPRPRAARRARGRTRPRRARPPRAACSARDAPHDGGARTSSPTSPTGRRSSTSARARTGTEEVAAARWTTARSAIDYLDGEGRRRRRACRSAARATWTRRASACGSAPDRAASPATRRWSLRGSARSRRARPATWAKTKARIPSRAAGNITTKMTRIPIVAFVAVRAKMSSTAWKIPQRPRRRCAAPAPRRVSRRPPPAGRRPRGRRRAAGARSGVQRPGAHEVLGELLGAGEDLAGLLGVLGEQQRVGGVADLLLLPGHSFVGPSSSRVCITRP